MGVNSIVDSYDGPVRNAGVVRAGRWRSMKGVRRICKNSHCRAVYEPGHAKSEYCCRGCRQSDANRRQAERYKREGYEKGLRLGIEMAIYQSVREMAESMIKEIQEKLEQVG